MDQQTLSHPDDDFTAVDASMISSTSPYQPTTEPVPHRRSFVAGTVVEMRFVKSLPGILKVAEIILSIIVAICVACVEVCAGSCAPVSFMQFVSITEIIVTSILFVVFAFNLNAKIEIINWPFTDLLNTAIATLLYLVASCVLAANSHAAADTAATVFGFLSVVPYAFSFWLAYKTFIVEYRKKHSPVSHIKEVPDNAETQQFA